MFPLLSVLFAVFGLAVLTPLMLRVIRALRSFQGALRLTQASVGSQLSMVRAHVADMPVTNGLRNWNDSGKQSDHA